MQQWHPCARGTARCRYATSFTLLCCLALVLAGSRDGRAQHVELRGYVVVLELRTAGLLLGCMIFTLASKPVHRLTSI